jgi:MFS transporter, BCD family, chlorophyll transporter
MSLSLTKPRSVKPKADAASKADVLPFHKTLRLMIPKLGVSYLFVLLLSVYNRIMITELKIGAVVVGLLYLTYNAMNILQVSNGRLADRRTIFGLRRTPLMFMGLLLSAVSLIALPQVAPVFAKGDTSALLLLVLIMMGFGMGFAMNGDSHNTLIAEMTEGKKNRPGVVSAVWLFQMVCIVGSGIAVSIILRNAETKTGIDALCKTAECVAARGQIALGLMPSLFMAGPIVCLLGLLPLIGLEPRLSSDQIKTLQARPALNLKEAYTRIFRNSQTRVFFFFVFVAIFSLFLQDDILEPFGGDVFKLAASSTSQFQPIMGGATIVAMFLVGIIASRWPIPKRTIANIGAVISLIGFALLAVSAMTHQLPLLYGGMVTLGFGMGTFNIGALSMMMDMTVPGETGSLMGAWGMSQALANGLSQFVGGGIRDAGIALTGNYEASYASIFCTSIVLCIVAVNLMARVDVQKFHRMTREQLGITIEAA